MLLQFWVSVRYSDALEGQFTVVNVWQMNAESVVLINDWLEIVERRK